MEKERSDEMEVAEEKDESEKEKIKEKVISIIFNISKKLEELEECKEINSRLWNISWEQGEFLELLLGLSNPTNILEIGTSNGFSTLWLAKGVLFGLLSNLNKFSLGKVTILDILNSSDKNNFLDFRIDTIEVREEIIPKALENFASVGLSDNINLIKGEALPLLRNLTRKYDFVFIDANKQEYIEYIKVLEVNKCLSDNVIIVADNIISHKTTKPFKDYMLKNYRTYIVDIGKGMSVSFLKSF